MDMRSKNAPQKSFTSRVSSGRIQLNVGGELYETYEKTLRRFPTTLLGDDVKRQLHYCPISDQFFFDRSRVFFDAILFFYQSSGVLSCPSNISYNLFQEECR